LGRKAREENEQAIFDMLRDVVERVKKEIETEKKERHNTEECLLTLLEDTCSKLNSVTRY
jgi:molybdopterin synthase catalytic subunit